MLAALGIQAMRILIAALILLSSAAFAEDKYRYVDASFLRLQIIRTFDKPVVFEVSWNWISHEPKKYSLKTMVFSGRGGDERGQKIHKEKRPLSAEELASLQNLCV